MNVVSCKMVCSWHLNVDDLSWWMKKASALVPINLWQVWRRGVASKLQHQVQLQHPLSMWLSRLGFRSMVILCLLAWSFPSRSCTQTSKLFGQMQNFDAMIPEAKLRAWHCWRFRLCFALSLIFTPQKRLTFRVHFSMRDLVAFVQLQAELLVLPTTLLYPTDEGTFPQPTGSDHPSHGYWRWVLPPPVGGSGPALPTELCGCVRSSKLHDQGLLSTGPAAAQCHVHIVVRLQGGLVPFPRELDNLDCAGWHQKMCGSWQHTQERIGRLGSLWLGSWWMFAATSRAFRESCGVVPQQEGTAVATHEKSSLFSAQLGCWGRPCKEKVHTSELQRHSHCNWQILSALWQWKSTFWQQSSPGLLWCPFWLVSSRRRAASERRNTSRERIGRRNWGPV